MATILVVDDRPMNREFLVTLLGYGGHRMLSAADGAEGLELTLAERPDLVIADALMPTMDGYEFVRQLRADPAIANTRVMFYTAHYHELEVRKLATACGVSDVLTKPCEPEQVLRIVEAVLSHTPTPVSSLATPEFDREHLHLLTDKLSQKVDELGRINERLTAMVELGLQLGSERDPGRLLQVFCDAAREIVGARYAVVGVSNNGEPQYRSFLTSGMSIAMAARVGRPGPLGGVLGSVIAAGRCFRTANHGGLDAAGVPASFPPATAVLAAPVQSPARVYGWVCLLDKLGADAFTDEDERLARMLASQVGRIYENGSLYANLVQHSTKLAEEVTERKRAEAEVHRTAELLRAVVDGTTDAVFVKDRDGKYLLFNEAAARFVGKPVTDVLGKDDTELFDGIGASRIMAVARSIMESGQARTTEEVLTAAGVTRTYQATQAPYRDNEGKINGVIGIARDVSEQRHLAAERDALLARLQLHVERMPLTYILFDADFRIIDWNPAAERLFGYTKAEALGKRPNDLYPPSFQQEASEILSRIRAGDMAAHSLNQNRTKDGRTITCEWLNTPLMDADGRFSGLLCLGQDVTARREAEATLRLRDRAIQAVAQGILIADPSLPDNPIVYASPGFLRLTGYKLEEILGRNCRFLQGKGTDPTVVASVRQAIQAGEPKTVEILNYRKDGTPFWNELSISPIRGDAGQVTHFVGVQADITARRSLEEQFRQAQKMEAVGRLAGGVAHDFNNLLTVINGYGELLLSSLPTDDPSRSLIREMVSAGDRAAGLTRQLLAFSRKTILEPKVLDLKAVVLDVERMLRRIVGEDVQLAVAADPELGAVKADPGQIEQVILNLVVNARDAMPTGGRLTIEVRNAHLDETYASTHSEAKPGPHVMLAVTDTGCGMDHATIARIFEPFFTTKGEHGTGLGLATVHGIVKQSGGHVAVYSEIGHGTTFKVYLPRIEKQEHATKSRPNGSAMPRGKETILLVEDEDSVRALTRHVLQSCGYTVLEATEGTEAVRIAEEHEGRIDLLVTDVVMPRMGGREVAGRMTEMHSGIKVLFLSGYTDDAVVRHGILEAQVAFLQKPFNLASLAAKVREVLDGGR